MENINIHPEVAELYHEMVKIRRQIHKFPELGFNLPLTSNFVSEYLSNLGLEVLNNIGKSGLIGLQHGEGPTLLFRADMDALPIHEENNLDYKSVNPGAMHACGHDAHITMLLIAAKILSKRKLKGTIKYLFEPAEEEGYGAQAMIADGALENPSIDEAFALHMAPNIPLGDFLLSDSYAAASSEFFEITITGAGGHGSEPHRANNPIVAATSLVTAFQSIVSNSIDTEYKSVLSVTYLHSGETYNAIPTHAKLKGTIRMFESEVKDLIKSRMMEIAEGTQLAFNCTVNLEFSNTFFYILNREPAIEHGLEAFEQISEGKRINERPMIGEDFGWFSIEKPGCYLMLGCGKPGNDYSLHSPSFMLNEESMMIGASWFVNLAQNLLN